MKTLNSILPSSVEATTGKLDVQISGIAFDSRKVKKDYLFVALPGSLVDGCVFIFDALERGASAVMLEGVRKNIEVPTVKVANARKALSEMASLFYDEPSKEINLYGITGTKGKTTVTYLVQSILKNALGKAFRLGTVEYDLEFEKMPAVNTTPESVIAQKIFHKCLEKGIKNGVMEVSSHALKNWRVEDLNFSVAAFTNLSLEHTEFHPSMEDYFNTKKRLFTEIASKEKPCIIGIDCKYGQRMAQECKEAGLLVKTVSLKDKTADYYAENISISGFGSDFQICTQGGAKYQCHLSMPGDYNVFNALMAAAMCDSMGISWDNIAAGLLEIKVIPGRMESVPNKAGINVVVDYAHSPDSLENVLRAMRKVTQNRLISVFGCGGNRSKEKRPIMGQVAYDNSDVVIITSDNPRKEEPTDIIGHIVAGINAEEGTSKKVIQEPDRKLAIIKALQLAQRGDTVVIAGKGHETGQQFSEHQIPFDDREIAINFFKVGEE
jgi:UDP-N-acetylmuramoyl-L-alanyl-D-glutamate--2,6-diaminopimelate ligase